MDHTEDAVRPAKRRMYKPAILRLPSLICLLLVTLTLIALTELACHRLRHADRSNHSNLRRQETQIEPTRPLMMHVKRNETALSVTTSPLSTTVSISASDSTTSTAGGSSLPLPTSGVYLPLGGDSTSTSSATSVSVNIPVGKESSSSTTTAIPGLVYLPLGKESSSSTSSDTPVSISLPPGKESPSSTTTAIPGPVYLPLGGPTISPGPSSPGKIYLPVGKSTSTPAQSYPGGVYLPVGKSSSTIITTATAGPVYLPVGNEPSSTTTAIPGPVYLPVGPSSSAPHPSSPGKVYLPVGDSTSTPAQSYPDGVYLPVGGSASSEITATAGPIYLPVGPDSSALLPTSKVYLPVGGEPSSTTTAIPGPVYLPVGPLGPDSSAPHPSSPGKVYLPVGQSTSTPAQSYPGPVYLPIGGEPSSTTTAIPGPVYLPVGKVSSAPPAQPHPVSIPLEGDAAQTSAAPGQPIYLPIGGDTNPSRASAGAIISIPRGHTPAPNAQGVGFENIPISHGPSGKVTGVAAGVSYSFGKGDSIVIDGSTFKTSTPTTAVLNDGRVAVIGSNGAVAIESPRTGPLEPTMAIQGSHKNSMNPIIGTANGVAYSIGAGGVAVVEGHTFRSSSPTTATLGDGHVVIVGSTGAIAIEDSKPSPKPTTGMINGLPYTLETNGKVVIDGQTFDPSKPMTTTLKDGHIILIGPSGVAVAQAAITNAPTPTTGVADGVSYTIEPDGALVIDGHTFKTSSPTTTTLADGHILEVGPSGVSVQNQTLPPEKSQMLPIREYVIGGFIPTLIAVLFGIPWHILSSALKEMEPFFQLQRANGASAEKSICLGYKASITPISTLNAFRNGHLLVWSSGIISLIVLLIPPLSSETVFIGFTDIAQCTITPTIRKNCYPVLSVYPLAARVIEGILAFVAVVILVIIITVSFRKTGVYANPNSLAALASIFQEQGVIEDFRRINAFWPDMRQLENALRGNRYRIGEFHDVDGSPSYGLVSIHRNTESTMTAYKETALSGNKKYASVAVHEVGEPLPTPMRRQSAISAIFTHSTTLSIFTAVIAGLLTLVIYYYKNGELNPFERFMDSQSFGTSFLFTTLGVIIKVYMTYLDSDLRINQPYRLMSTKPTQPRYSILSSPPSNPFTGLFHSLTHANFLSAYFSLTTLLCEPLIVALSAVPFKLTSSFKEFIVSTWLTVAILSMILIGLVSLLYARWTWYKRAKLYANIEGKGGRGIGEGEARAPETLAEGLWLLAGSRMVGDFRGMGGMSGAERDEIVRKWGRVYEIGTVVGVDGVERVGVEEAVLGGDE